MENEDKKVDEVVDEEVVEDDETTQDETEPTDETTEDIDWKERALKAEGIVKRYKTKETKTKEKTDTVSGQKTEKGFGLVEKTFLKASGINSNEFELVQNFVKETGLPIDELVEKKWFQAELKEYRDSVATKSATPKGNSRSAQSARDTVDYWIAKGELPPADQVELRRKVVNERLRKETSGSKFSSNPIV